MIFYASENAEIFGLEYEESVPGEENRLCLFVVIIALGLSLAIGFRFYAFGTLAQKITQVLRISLYDSILKKDQGFFELDKFKDVDYLNSVIQDDAEVLSGISHERYGPYIEGFFAVVTAIVISSIFRWQ